MAIYSDMYAGINWDMERSPDNSGWKRVLDQNFYAQNIKQRLQTVVGEWFLNTSIYADLWDIVFVKGTPAAVIESHLKEIISGTPDFDAFQSFTLDINNADRQLLLDFQVIFKENIIVNASLIGAASGTFYWIDSKGNYVTE